MKRVFLDLHAIQTVPPSCVNRDDTGSPKTAQYGGVTRARVSSQSWKKAMRDSFSDYLPKEDLGVRSKKILKLITKEIEKLDDSANAQELAEQILKNAGIKLDKDGETGALFFLSYVQAKELARIAVEHPEYAEQGVKTAQKKEIQTILNGKPSVDLAFFGRMVADEPSLNVDASAQVAHAISTHDISNEYDYFTAVDDLGSEEHAGAAHIGTVEYNSATLYRYANVAVHDLYLYLQDDTFAGIDAFINTFVKSMPTGKQNTFANRTLPDALVLIIRTDQPINMVGAFEKNIPASSAGYVDSSKQRLVEHAKLLYGDFANEPAATYVVGQGLDVLGERVDLQTAIDNCIDYLQSILIEES